MEWIINHIGVIAPIVSVILTTLIYRNQREAAWALSKVNDSTWRLERRRRRSVVLVGLAVIPSYYNCKISGAGPAPRFYSKGDSVVFRVMPSSGVTDLTGMRLCVFYRSYFFKSRNQHVYDEELTKEIISYVEPMSRVLQVIESHFARDEPAPTFSERTKKKWLFRLKTWRIKNWNNYFL